MSGRAKTKPGRRFEITDGMCAAWRLGDDRSLRRLLGLYPFQLSPMSGITSPPDPTAPIVFVADETKPQIWQLRCELLEACGPHGNWREFERRRDG